MQFLQEFSIKQGVVGSKSEPATGFIPENSYNGAHIGIGLGLIGSRKMGCLGLDKIDERYQDTIVQILENRFHGINAAVGMKTIDKRNKRFLLG